MTELGTQLRTALGTAAAERILTAGGLLSCEAVVELIDPRHPQLPAVRDLEHHLVRRQVGAAAT